jgi:hypothetical protein
MNVIENFSLLSKQEQRAFAEALIKTINSERTFIDDNTFEIYNGHGGVDADDTTGNLYIDISHKDLINVDREATWQGDVPDDVYDPEYYDTDEADIKKAFKTTSAVIDGYKVTLNITDYNYGKIEDYRVERSSHEDSGIGSYEYGGVRGYDSRPYTESVGVVTLSYDVALYLLVEPVDEVFEDEEDFDNAKDGDFDPDDRRDEMPWDRGKHFDD